MGVQYQRNQPDAYELQELAQQLVSCVRTAIHEYQWERPLHIVNKLSQLGPSAKVAVPALITALQRANEIVIFGWEPRNHRRIARTQIIQAICSVDHSSVKVIRALGRVCRKEHDREVLRVATDALNSCGTIGKCQLIASRLGRFIDNVWVRLT